MQYALAASHQALEDAGWHPDSEQEKEMTVCGFPLSLSGGQTLIGNRGFALAQVSAASKKSTKRPSHTLKA